MSTLHVTNDRDIVLVDDDELEIKLFARFMTLSQLNNPLQSFTSGEEFLSFMNEVDQDKQPVPAIAMIDVRMPVMNGFEVVQAVRANPSFAEIPMVVMFSNSDAPVDEQKARDAGADAYIVKPQGFEGYLQILNMLATGQEIEGESPVTYFK
ncbi:Gliding motility regulatory protein [Stieleria maiorica]|uniref:Gliding motility regulatory protein n=1 Tax=Stieleria maiorica TaxID=2795974 RepID=A0A5B9MFG3_9BACT|nr:response regulator [Stieleria maiorica]QEF98344.1 Gliding motility regulatory protein [Stieleria maiorica]